VEISVQVPVGASRVAVVGAAERNLKMIREALGVHITARSGAIAVKGERRNVSIARGVLERLASREPDAEPPDRDEVLRIITEEISTYGQDRPGAVLHAAGAATADAPGTPTWDGSISVYVAGRQVQPKSDNQRSYLEAIRTHDLIFGIGPAGTGKTYLAVAAAVHLLRQDRVRKLILARPAVEAGEKLGFLPGDLEAKVNPYLRPLFDALHDMMDYATVRRFMDSDVVEIVPLAFMRGRTLNNAVIILDEAQNTTKGQMHMALTRLGQGSKMIVTGDITQIDLPDATESGLIDAARRLSRVPGVAFAQLSREDVVRHALVQRIVDAYGLDQPAATAAPARRPGRRRADPAANGDDA
jgi:phosphate starvation-inducible protein PhoH and related proteins